MAERSKAPVSGTGLFGGVGSNPTPIILFSFCRIARFVGVVRLLVGRLGAENGVWVKTGQQTHQQQRRQQKIAETGNRTQASAATTRGTAIILSRRPRCAALCTQPADLT